MDSDPISVTHRPPAGGSWYLGIALFCSVMGAVFLFLFRAHNQRYDWTPLQVQLSPDAATTSASFTAELGESHEIEVEFDEHLPAAELYRLALSPTHTPDFSLQWSVSRDQQQVAAGTAQACRYVKESPRSSVRRLVVRLLGMQDIKGQGTTMARGIGMFPCVQGQTYGVQTTYAVGEALRGTQPRLVVRVNRLFAERHYRQRFYLAILSAMSFAMGGLVFLTGLCTRLFRHKHADH